MLTWDNLSWPGERKRPQLDLMQERVWLATKRKGGSLFCFSSKIKICRQRDVGGLRRARDSGSKWDWSHRSLTWRLAN